jgi:hypothetical protein
MNEKDTSFDMNDFNIKDYFTKDIDNRIRELSDGEMEALLRELEDSPFWIAILKYNNDRLRFAQDGLITGDPFKEPTLMARNQGIMMGITDLQNAVIMLTMRAEKKAAESEKKSD